MYFITDKKKNMVYKESRDDHEKSRPISLELSLDINNQIVRLLRKDELPEWVEDLKKDNIEDSMQHVFLIGSKGIPASYGGFETFVENLTSHKKNNRILYHVSRLSANKYRYEYNGAVCFDINVPNIGSSKAVYYDYMALRKSLIYCKQHRKIQRPIFFIMACRIGPFMNFFCKKIHRIGGKVYVNPDGHEWKRSKWSFIVREYWKHSERLMIKYADCVICDSKSIEKYIIEEYKKYRPNTKFIAYGSDIIDFDKGGITDTGIAIFEKWCRYNHITKYNYYLIVGRFVPENNYETMISEFMRSHSKKQLVIVTTRNKRLFTKLMHKYHFTKDERIKFVGEIYNQDLLSHIRYFAYGYIHGHEVGGTNPSLLEALGSTKINLLLNVGFNREVAKDGALYWTKEKYSLSNLIDRADKLTISEVDELGMKAHKRITDYYNWPNIVNEYEKLFVSN